MRLFSLPWVFRPLHRSVPSPPPSHSPALASARLYADSPPPPLPCPVPRLQTCTMALGSDMYARQGYGNTVYEPRIALLRARVTRRDKLESIRLRITDVSSIGAIHNVI
jgi:hypothetical protein